MSELLIYGSYGYTGRLVARQASVDGLDPILAGRTAESVHEQAEELACRSRVFEATNPDTVADYLEGNGLDRARDVLTKIVPDIPQMPSLPSLPDVSNALVDAPLDSLVDGASVTVDSMTARAATHARLQPT